MNQFPHDTQMRAPARDPLDGMPIGYECGARVATSRGLRSVCDLRPGDLLLTRDLGFSPLLVALPLEGQQPAMVVQPDALGPGMPLTALRLSPWVRATSIRGEAAEAAELRRLPNVSITGPTRMWMLLFEGQTDILMEGAWVQCPQPSARVIAAVLPHLSEDNRQHLVASFAHVAVHGQMPNHGASKTSTADVLALRMAGYLH